MVKSIKLTTTTSINLQKTKQWLKIMQDARWQLKTLVGMDVCHQKLQVHYSTKIMMIPLTNLFFNGKL